jgi:hypothetical protein
MFLGEVAQPHCSRRSYGDISGGCTLALFPDCFFPWYCSGRFDSLSSPVKVAEGAIASDGSIAAALVVLVSLPALAPALDARSAFPAPPLLEPV